MKKIFTLAILLCSCTLFAQQYNNEWIRYSQQYFKFKVGKTGLYRIPQSVLQAAGIDATDVGTFELWRNGVSVPFFPSVPSGPLPANGYIEFWGEINDGKADKALYRDPAYQHTDQVSLETDTAVYFLSINTNHSGLQVFDYGNDVASNVLPAEPYFLHNEARYFKNKMNLGFAVVIGEYLYSSSYDKGEYWSSLDIRPATPMVVPTITGLFPYAGGPAPQLNFGASGNALNARTIKVRVNSVDVKDTTMDYFNDLKSSVTLPSNSLSAGTAAITFSNTSPVAADRLVVSYFELIYPRQFNFGATKNFTFKLPAKSDGYYLEVTNFNFGTVAPVLYDLTIGQRIVGDIAVPGKIRFVLQSSDTEHRFVLVNEEPANINTVTALTPKTFVDYSKSQNQGNYIVITHPSMFSGTNGRNPVAEYKAYRQSPEGGGYDVAVVDINEITDQFAFGIKKHPMAIKNFLRYGRNAFSSTPKFVFIIGRGVAYNEYYSVQNNPDADRLNLVPSFGSPASDNMLSSENSSSPSATTPIGRLSAIYPAEVENYIEKVIEYETAQRTLPQTIAARGWMKNIVHVTGSSDPFLGTVLCNYMAVYRQLIEDTVYGGHVTTFCKQSSNPIEQLASGLLDRKFEEGISMLTYFGHSSSTTLEFNLDEPARYNNPGKYPVFYVNGCNAGNFFTFNTQRLSIQETLSEKFVLAKQRGSIAFVASTHYGIVNYLNLYLDNLYGMIGGSDFGKSLGELNRDAMKKMVDNFGSLDFYSRIHAEQMTLHGDPALVLNYSPKPDYVMETPQILLKPSYVSVADKNFTLKVRMYNIGKASSDSIRLAIRREYPDGSFELIYNENIQGLRSADSISFLVPVLPGRDKGLNKITVTLDSDNKVDEITENNNSASTDFFVFEDEARPIYPYEFSIVSDPTQKLYASTADPFSVEKPFIIEMDTTENFNSSLKISRTVTTKGGAFSIDPGIAYQDSVVYYWRVAPVPANGTDFVWNRSSFVYLSNSSSGWNQSHYFQNLKNGFQTMEVKDDRKFSFTKTDNSLYIKSSLYPFGRNTANYNDQILYSGGCGTYLNSLEFVVFDMNTGENFKNQDIGGSGLYGSLSAACPDNGIKRVMYFDFYYNNATYRKRAMDFLDSIPNGSMIMLMNWGSTTFNSNPQFVNTWMKDTLLYGTNNSIYHKLLAIGLTKIDSFYRNIPFVFAFQKNNDGSYTVLNQEVGVIPSALVTAKGNFQSFHPTGKMISEIVGPSKNWKSVHWAGSFENQSATDSVVISIFGINRDGEEQLLFESNEIRKDTTLDFISASNFPKLRFQLFASDHTKYDPYQLAYWQVKYDEVPEGIIQPNVTFSFKDTVDIGEVNKLKVAFTNISKASFDSLDYKLVITDKNNQQKTIIPNKLKPLSPGDSVTVSYNIETTSLSEENSMFIDVNPDIQPEQYRFNNFLYKSFYVRPDRINPLLDVTFDGVHILNRDMVSAKPHIQIKIKDEAKYMLLNDTALSSVMIKFPDGTTRTYKFDNDTLRFTPATSGGDNTATIDFTPAFIRQFNPEGDEYELIVKGKDRSGNKAGEVEYRVSFKVVLKPMISNLLNYPNPFSSSTAFVFTVTGSEIPQNMKIQILTVTGKVVREITKEELGSIHIGRNVTEYKWNGTDQFGQKLANGVYLYRLVTTLNGRPMDKFKAEGENTDKYFNNGYGKMYLMR
ncbi:MAG TPA: C25 family cysteine peptidase [Flavitalea sp.]|nr:C25 family cysteine peptidase [Flavitalea sp.]